MLGALVIVFREVLEAGLIIGIVLAATRGAPGRGNWIAAGMLAGVLGAGIIALFAGAIADAFEGSGQELLNAAVLTTDLTAADAIKRIAVIALLKQDLTGIELLGMAKPGDPLQLIGTEIRKQRVHLENDREFRLLAHRNSPLGPDRPAGSRRDGFAITI